MEKFIFINDAQQKLDSKGKFIIFQEINVFDIIILTKFEKKAQ
jgi:predicted GTPase